MRPCDTPSRWPRTASQREPLRRSITFRRRRARLVDWLWWTLSWAALCTLIALWWNA